jgi:hypothetical protein
MNPFVYSLMLLVPLGIVGFIAAHRERRAREERERAEQKK